MLQQLGQIWRKVQEGRPDLAAFAATAIGGDGSRRSNRSR